MNKYTVWAGGVEVNQYYITKIEAEKLAAIYIAEGYEDVYIEKVQNYVRTTKDFTVTFRC